MDATKGQPSDSNIWSTTERTSATSSQTNDLLSRVSSFLPQIQAANRAALMEPLPPPLLYQEDDENDGTGDESDDSPTQHSEFRSETKGDINPKSLCSNGSGNSDDSEVPKLSKKRKLEQENPTIVMDLHFNQDIEPPLFQFLCDEKEKVEGDTSDITNHRNNHRSSSESSPTTFDLLPAGAMLLTHDKGTRDHPLISVIDEENNDQQNVW
jgi:hypothetical protein